MNTIGKILWLTSRVNTAVTLCCVCSGAVCENGVMSRNMKTNICLCAFTKYLNISPSALLITFIHLLTIGDYCVVLVATKPGTIGDGGLATFSRGGGTQ